NISATPSERIRNCSSAGSIAPGTLLNMCGIRRFVLLEFAHGACGAVRAAPAAAGAEFPPLRSGAARPVYAARSVGLAVACHIGQLRRTSDMPLQHGLTIR